MGKVTIKDVAEAAGVRPSTVSYILNKSRQGFAPETVERVTRLARELGYRPDAAARSLRAGCSEMIGILLSPNIDVLQGSVAYQLAAGVGLEAQDRSYDLAQILVSDTSSMDKDLQHVARVVDARRVDGIILQNPVRNSRVLPFLLEMKIPFVVIGRPQLDGLYWVDNNNIELGRMVTRHLIELGHRKLAYISPGPDYVYAMDRELGFKEAVAAAGIPHSDAPVVVVEDSHRGAAEATFKLAAEGRMPTGLFAADDRLASGVLYALGEMGLSVPGDVSVAGCNNMPIVGDGRFLTTVELHMPRVGQMAARKLLAILNGQEPSQGDMIPVELMVRGSTAPPKQ